MQFKLLYLSLTLFFLNSTLLLNAQSFSYPNTKRVDQVDDYHGNAVSDPYRWLEDDMSEETGAWVKQQNELTFSYLSNIPFRSSVKDRLSQLWNYQKYSAPIKIGQGYYYFRNTGLQNQSTIFYQPAKDMVPMEVLDPNALSKDGTVAISGTTGSKDGRYLAYTVSSAGSDWNSIKVLDLKTKKHTDDQIEWVKFSGISWDGDAFYYSAYDKPSQDNVYSKKNQFHKVYLHRLGEPQSSDQLIYEDKEHPQRNFGAQVTKNKGFVILYGSESTSGNMIYYKRNQSSAKSFNVLVNDFDYDYSVIDNVGDSLLILTNNNAPNNRLIYVDINKPERENWITLVAEDKGKVLESVSMAGSILVLKYLHNATHQLEKIAYNGKSLGRIEMPSIGSIGSVSSDKEDDFVYISLTTFTKPTTIYKYHLINQNLSIHFEPKVAFTADQYETKQVWYSSKDGTKVPMFIISKKDLIKDGTNPCLMYGYGGFDISILPMFKPEWMLMLEQGGIVAIPNLRGGGEFGKAWHVAGTKEKKQNVFDDYISAAEYLIKENYTNSEILAISGRSNGGLLVGACMTQRPDLFKVAFPAVGVLDMLRFHKFTIGWAWTYDYGSSDNKTDFEYLIKYSPLHNIKKGVQYPATMVTTADHDDRVVPAHSFKFAAELQYKASPNNPALIRIDTNAGHGSGKPTSKKIEEEADIFSFMFYNFNKVPKY
ncbi:MAG TPA: prolyl oligopeptidase family serine peptidase [Bacteroidia bacterium]|nr:prolyl oligopeptidase family serine peptidase [Bacteroidia bacterium]HNT79780.1 prolyl oligopeptidase family serine peptidase [Bacteroidia bacterium]